MDKLEDKKFLSTQIITYLGNKRSLLHFIGNVISIVMNELNTEKIVTLDLFSGSGIVSRFLKQYSSKLYTNDLEDYTYVINNCYLANPSKIDLNLLTSLYSDLIIDINKNGLKSGFISELYAPKDDTNIQLGERAFFTTRNANYIDTARQYIENIEYPYKYFLLAPLLYEASVKNNTSGVFKGFYKNSKTNIGQFGGNGKNALSRITSDISLQLPVFSNFECEVNVLKEDANIVAKNLKNIDLAYLDPPYNQHPYGSNYFMLNLITNYKKPINISNVSGIPKNWNKSTFNQKSLALKSLENICSNLDAKYILISFNSEGFIDQIEMETMLKKYGNVRVYEQKYNTYRACRNLNNRNIHIKEYLYLLKREK